MMINVFKVVKFCNDMLVFNVDLFSKVVNCYYNYVKVEIYFGREVFFIRKGVVGNYNSLLFIFCRNKVV